MDHYALSADADGVERVQVPYRGQLLLRHPMFNKGTAFTHAERRAFGLMGLLPMAVSSLEQQARRAYAGILRKASPLERYVGMAALQDRNEVLFQRVLLDHLEELFPIVYTPTVAEACLNFSHIFRRSRGLWITPGHRDEMDAVLASAPLDDVRLVVVTDNERVLGFGDQGVGGIGLPIGKLAVYTAAAGIHPSQTLPVSLDVGTDNRALLDDDLYLGWRHERLSGEEYESLVADFVRALARRFPRAILQWEDFERENAFRLFARHRHEIPCFNDDIHGSAVLALAGVLAVARATATELTEQRCVVVGAGLAGTGAAQLLRESLRQAGLSAREALSHVAVLDSQGLIVAHPELRDPRKRELAWPSEMAAHFGMPVGSRDLASVIRALRPSVVIGASGQPGLLDRALVQHWARDVERPAVLLWSQPERRAEVQPRQVLDWTGGRALVATPSPRAALSVGASSLEVSQATTALVFPGVALGMLVSEARELSPRMLRGAAEAVAARLPATELATGALFPALGELRRVAAGVAEAVAREAEREGTGRALPDAAAEVRKAMWVPGYPVFVPAPASVSSADRELCPSS